MFYYPYKGFGRFNGVENILLKENVLKETFVVDVSCISALVQCLGCGCRRTQLCSQLGNYRMPKGMAVTPPTSLLSDGFQSSRYRPRELFRRLNQITAFKLNPGLPQVMIALLQISFGRVSTWPGGRYSWLSHNCYPCRLGKMTVALPGVVF